MIAKFRLALLVALGAAALASPLWGPPVLRRVSWFQVQRVEISGTRLLAPHQVLAASGIRRGQNVWDDASVWERALRANPAIADARVSRRLPATLRIRVEEKRAVAYVEETTLQPVTATGERLPLDPTRAPVDLPILRGPWDRLPAALRAELLGETARLSHLDPALLADVSEISAADSSAHALLLTHRLADIVLPVGAGSERLAELNAVLTDLEGRLPDSDSGAEPARVDLRYGEQVVVRIPSSVSVL
jgi:cell division septal protein FtsQ